eukprot:TRINITY_DN8006_c0_g1_i1.p2 TRINITY_DN8006_c0_g1~~TRINITY_DN8006_c0_g1_i1.p2  ORF type:complete len:151 (-),score=50.25 TRINITY_DN8006_c0_g1_i1:148-600(-)
MPKNTPLFLLRGGSRQFTHFTSLVSPRQLSSPSSLQYTAMMHEKTRLAQDLAAARSGTDASAADAAARARALEAEAADLKAVVVGKDREIAAAQQQLTGKLADSSQFKTLKKLLAQRTQHVKELRTRLNKYEPDSAATTTLVEDSSSDDD